MKNKGFTLAELLAVIVILGVIAVITVPIVTKTLASYRTKLCENQIQNIKEAARIWGSDNLLSLPDKENGTLVITLNDLQDKGYIDKDINNPRTKKIIDPTTKITITRVGKKYNYTVDYTC